MIEATVDIEFREVPPRPTGKWATIADHLRERPGEWAKCVTYATKGSARNGATNVRTGYFKAMPAGEFEATARGCDVWVRYIGRAA